MLRVLPALLGLAVGCSPSVDDSGCNSPPPRAIDAVATGIQIQNHAPPCLYANSGVRGSEGHLVALLDCHGDSDPFLVAVKVDGKLVSLVETRGAGYGAQLAIDAGPWEAPDTLWHQTELIVDPLNLFKETDETNNRVVGEVRTIPPDIGLNLFACRFLVAYVEVTQVTAGTPVRVEASSLPAGRYQSFELSARSGTVMNFADTLSMRTCESFGGGAPIVGWDWTPPGPGTYSVEFRVRPLSGEPDRDPANNLLTRTLTVVPVSAEAP